MRRLSISETPRITYWLNRKASLFWAVVLSGAAALVIMVAALQYRWTKELSDVSEARIGSNLEPLMLGWHLDLYGEFSAICVALQVGPDSGARENWRDYAQRYAEWSHAAMNNDSLENIHANPDVVKNIYIWQTSDEAKPRLFRLDPDSATLETSEEPEGLKALLSRLRAKSSSLPVALRAWEFSNSLAEGASIAADPSSPSLSLRSEKVTGWQFDAHVPAVVHPILQTGRPVSSDGQVTSSENPVDWIVVVLDRDTIQKRILPTLTKRYFSSRDGLEYKVAVVAPGKTPPLIFATDPDFPRNNHSQFDSRMNIFGPPPESVEGHFWQSIKNGESLRREEWHSFSSPVWFPVIQYASREEPWMLLLQHRTGPLQAIATSIWYRNLLTGGIVLLLLTLDVVLIIIASRSAQKLAKLHLDFVASVSHELLTPLAAIYCTGQNAKDGLIQTTSDLTAHGSIVTSQARQLIDLVRQNLLFAATESGTNRYTFQPLQVTEILQAVRKDLAMLIEESRFRLDEHVQAGLPTVIGDLSALSRCLQNLIVNAIKYSGRNGWIGISASLHEAQNHEKEVRISVEDRGPGISSSELRHIFEPFYRSPKVVDAQIHGTGLGLTVAQRIAEAMGGKLSVVSQLAVGTTFTLHLPALSKKNAELVESLPEMNASTYK